MSQIETTTFRTLSQNYNKSSLPYFSHPRTSFSPSFVSTESDHIGLPSGYNHFPTVPGSTTGNGSEILVQVGGAASIKCYTNYNADELVSK